MVPMGFSMVPVSEEPWLDRFLLSQIGTEMLTSHYVASMEAPIRQDPHGWSEFWQWTSAIAMYLPIWVN